MVKIETYGGLYKPGDFREAIKSVHNYIPQSRREIDVNSLNLKGLSVEEKFKVLEKLVASKNSMQNGK